MRIGKYEYPDHVLDVVKISKQIKMEFKKFCKEKGINKSKLVEEFYRKILLRYHDGSLNAAKGYLTLNISPQHVLKKQKLFK